MTYFEALERAEALAARYGDRLGHCIFAFADIPCERWWYLQFNIIDDPTDWCWLLRVNEIEEKELMLAKRGRPSTDTAPPVGLLP